MLTLGICPPGVAAGQPMPVNMAYFGGNVQVNPKIYIVYWGWGEAGAFDHTMPRIQPTIPTVRAL